MIFLVEPWLILTLKVMQEAPEIVLEYVSPFLGGCRPISDLKS
jgi:hypothetical protein